MEYKIFESDLYWKNRLMQAELVTQPESYLSLTWDIWKADTLEGVMPLLKYKLPVYPTMPDFVTTGSIMWLFSQRFLRVLKEFGILFESFPIILLDKKTKMASPLQYEVFHLQQVMPIIDCERSDMTGRESIKKIVLHQLDPAPEFAMVRDSFLRSLVFIREDLREKMEQERILGGRWIEVEDFKYTPNKRPWEASSYSG